MTTDTTTQAEKKQHVTPRQREFLRTLRKLTKARGIPPSLAELAEALNTHISTVRTRTRRMEKQGYVRNTEGPHGIILTVKGLKEC